MGGLRVGDGGFGGGVVSESAFVSRLTFFFWARQEGKSDGMSERGRHLKGRRPTARSDVRVARRRAGGNKSRSFFTLWVRGEELEMDGAPRTPPRLRLTVPVQMAKVCLGPDRRGVGFSVRFEV